MGSPVSHYIGSITLILPLIKLSNEFIKMNPF